MLTNTREYCVYNTVDEAILSVAERILRFHLMMLALLLSLAGMMGFIEVVVENYFSWRNHIRRVVMIDP